MIRLSPSLAPLVVWLAVLQGSAVAQTPPSTTNGADATFRVFVQGRQLGTETATVSSSDAGWKVTSTGQLAAPLDITIRLGEVTYDREWRPLGLTLNGMVKGQTTTIKTTFAGGKATSEITQGQQTIPKTDAVSDQTLVLPNGMFGAYEALAARLVSAEANSTFRAYIAPQAEIGVTVDAITTERVQAPGRTFEARRYSLTFSNPNGPLKAELWSDAGRLMRLSIPTASIEVVRDDIASVATRQTSAYRPNDEDFRAPGNGFSIAGTISTPTELPPAQKGKPARLPAIILVRGSGPLDRDETVAGIPIFAQLADQLANAGFLVARYDKRGIGQTGGRAESAGIPDFAEDLRAVVKYLAGRPDVDEKRITVVGHSEGASVALLTGQREKKISALVLMAAPGTKGTDLILEQQRRLLDRLKTPDAEKQAKIALQQKIQDAVLTGKGWEEIPPELQKQADSTWFRSVLAFDPASVMPKVRQPILIVHGELDAQVPPHHAEKLAALARARKKPIPVEVAMLPGVNHLLVPAKTGEVDEYAALGKVSVVPEAGSRIKAWLDGLNAARLGS